MHAFGLQHVFNFRCLEIQMCTNDSAKPILRASQRIQERGFRNFWTVNGTASKQSISLQHFISLQQKRSPCLTPWAQLPRSSCGNNCSFYLLKEGALLQSMSPNFRNKLTAATTAPCLLQPMWRTYAPVNLCWMHCMLTVRLSGSGSPKCWNPVFYKHALA